MKNPPVLPDSVLKRMPKEDRDKLGKAGKTAAECQQEAVIKGEKDLQRHMANMLNLRKMHFFQVPFGKKTGMTKGYPDFTIFLSQSRVLLVEAKIDKGELSEDQEKWHGAYWSSTECKVHVVRTLNEFKQILDKVV